MKITVLGAAGGIGQPLALLLKLQLPPGSSLALYDIAPLTPGVAVDLSHIPTDVKVLGYGGEDASEALHGAQVVLIPAGVPRKPGMTRDDLFNVNAGIVKKLVETSARACPGACIAIITNPVNSTVPIAAEVLKKAGVYDERRLFGVTTLDVIRSATFVADLARLEPAKLDVRVIGGHSGTTILPLLSQLPVKFSEDEAKKLTLRIQDAGTEVVNAKAGGGSATLSMAQAGARFAISLLRGLSGGRAVECTFVADPKGRVPFFARPALLGPRGVEDLLDIGPMNAYEKQSLESLYGELEGNIKKGVEFAR